MESQQEEISARQRWAPRVAVAAVGLVVGLLLASRRDEFSGASVSAPSFSLLMSTLAYNAPTLLVAGLIYARQKRSAVLVAGLVCVAINVIARTVRQMMGPEGYPMSTSYLVAIFVELCTADYVIISMLVLATHHFRGKLERVRQAGLVIIPLVVVGRELMLILARDGIYGTLLERALYTGSAWVAPVLGIFAAWCVAFRHVAAHRPPADSGREVSLICPRCQVSLLIRAGHGECANCRLQISISLDEGVCAGCGYLLRGLTGGKCPECGEALAKAAHDAAERSPTTTAPT